MKRTEHRTTVWAGGVKGFPVTCACGWKTYASSARAGYRKASDHRQKHGE